MPFVTFSGTASGLSRSGSRERGSIVSMLRRGAATVALWPVRVVRARREYARLAALTEHELRDIGLTRGDLADVTALPLDEDPTLVLARKVEERRIRRGSRRT